MRWSWRRAGRLALPGRTVEIDPETEAACERVVARLAGAGYQPPDLEQLAGELGDGVPRLVELLCDQGRLVRIGPDFAYTADLYGRARDAIVANCERNGHLEVPELRDELGTTRKFLIPLLEHFDAVGLTMRQAANRVLKRR